VDPIAVFGYTLGGLPLIGIALLELGLIFRKSTEQEKMKITLKGGSMGGMKM
jgi:hypothetical protein